MRISDLIRLGAGYLKLGVIVIMIVLFCFLIGYFILYKKIFKGKKTINFKLLLLWGIFLCYIFIVIGVTLMDRSGLWLAGEIHPLFYSYKDAWFHYSAVAWRNIILNFCMFIPFGFLLPWGIKWFRNFWKTYLAGFLFSVLIEITQLLLQRGMFELDDLLGNTVGAMIGYGLFVLVLSLAAIVKKEEQSRKRLSIFALQLPLLITVCSFSIIFGVYTFSELGNHPYRYIEPYDKSMINVSLEVQLKDENINLPTYEIPVLGVDEAMEKGRQLFENLGTTVDESRTDVYDESLLLYSSDNNSCSVWIEYKGGTCRLVNFEVLSLHEEASRPQPISGADEKTIRALLENFGFIVPEDCEFESSNRGEYCFTASMIETENGILNGRLVCTYYGNQEIGDIDNNILTCTPYKEYTAISEQEAYEKIKNGEFRYFGNETLDIEIKSCTLIYTIDSKGYYQPTYQFECSLNGKESEILIPAYE